MVLAVLFAAPEVAVHLVVSPAAPDCFVHVVEFAGVAPDSAFQFVVPGAFASDFHFVVEVVSALYY